MDSPIPLDAREALLSLLCRNPLYIANTRPEWLYYETLRAYLCARGWVLHEMVLAGHFTRDGKNVCVLRDEENTSGNGQHVLYNVLPRIEQRCAAEIVFDALIEGLRAGVIRREELVEERLLGEGE